MQMNMCSYIAIEPVEFTDAMSWAERKSQIKSTIRIPKWRGKSYFRLSIIDEESFLLESDPSERYQKYVLTKEEWDKFLNFRDSLPRFERGLSDSFSKACKNWGCGNIAFWPSIQLISIACRNSRR